MKMEWPPRIYFMLQENFKGQSISKKNELKKHVTTASVTKQETVSTPCSPTDVPIVRSTSYSFDFDNFKDKVTNIINDYLLVKDLEDVEYSLSKIVKITDESLEYNKKWIIQVICVI